MRSRLGVRWTIGDVNPAGFEALRLSVHGAMQLFGDRAEYRVYVNTVPVRDAQRRTGATPPGLQWEQSHGTVPAVLSSYLDQDMAEGVAWKLTPLRAFPQRYELSLDNDVILWRLPPALEQWLAADDPTASLIAADIKPAFGQFAGLCGEAARNSGIRGLGPALDFEAAIANVLRRHPARLQSELDEQGLQVAALTMSGEPYVVETTDVTICSPFYPHDAELGACGAHFVGLNTRHLPWCYYGRPATEVRLEHWLNLRAELYARVGLPFHADDPVPLPETG
jgi:hypothetical protein